MLDTTKTAPVVTPRPGQTLRLWALEARPAWYPVHRVGLEHAAPCTPRDCCYDLTRERRGVPTWEGYLLCCVARQAHQVCVIRLPRWLYEASTDLQCCPDFRGWEWLYSRGPGRSSVAIACNDGEWTSFLPVEFVAGRSHWPHVLAWWVLPEQAPDYRLSVYVDLVPRVAPSAEAKELPLLRGDGT
jgi:hypothetical protein